MTCTIAALFALIFQLGIGYYSYIDHEKHTIFFVKKGLTFKREFVNPFANEGDAMPVGNLLPSVREELADFCRYKYGTAKSDKGSLETCRARARIIL